MSIIIASGETISRSPINTSKSKQMYSFAKTSRFQDFKRSTGPHFYKLPSMISTRCASFGFGKKSDFTSGNKKTNVSFNYYPTEFNPKKPNSPSYTFGISREFYEKVYNEADIYHDKNFPGPGKYKQIKIFGSEGAKFSFIGRNQPKNLASKTNVPGPGMYPQLGIKPDGKYMYSRYKNTTGIVWGSSKEKRFRYKDFKNYIPGPGNYHIKSLINGEGKLFDSKFKSCTAKTIAEKFMDPTSKLKSKYCSNIAPGPGSYRTFSEFGIYESKFAKTAENFSKSNQNIYSSKDKIFHDSLGTYSTSVLNTDITDYKK